MKKDKFLNVNNPKPSSNKNRTQSEKIQFGIIKRAEPKNKKISKIIVEVQNSNISFAEKKTKYFKLTENDSSSPSKKVTSPFISSIRNKFMIQNKKNIYNFTPLKRRTKSPVIHNDNNSLRQYSDSKKQNSPLKKDKFLISTLPRAKIDISDSDSMSHYMNITFNNDEIINFYLKLKSSKNSKLSNDIIIQLKSLRDVVDNIINKYKTLSKFK